VKHKYTLAMAVILAAILPTCSSDIDITLSHAPKFTSTPTSVFPATAPKPTLSSVSESVPTLNSTTDAPPEGTRVLFVGNSYIFTNDLPDMFAKLARSGGYEVSVEVSAKGGWTLDLHTQTKTTIENLEQRRWDYVVLQEQSVIPAQPEERENRMYPAVRFLNAKIEDSGADAILFLTWGRRDGLSREGFEDFAAMQAELELGYMGIADELDLMVAPVGIAWQGATKSDSELTLWSEDGSHPSEKGVYLAACVFYAVVFRRSPEGLGYVAGLSEEEARYLQSVVAETVLEDTGRWNIR
jgi:hypothetical protein